MHKLCEDKNLLENKEILKENKTGIKGNKKEEDKAKTCVLIEKHHPLHTDSSSSSRAVTKTTTTKFTTMVTSIPREN